MSLTYAEARTRAAQVSDVTYRIDLDLTSRESFGCRTTVTFALADPRATTFLELADAQGPPADGQRHAGGVAVVRRRPDHAARPAAA